MKKQDITLQDLYLAYRKAKAEAYYENTHFHALDFTEFEANLDENLRRLLSLVHDPDHPWTDVSELGSYSYLPKSVDCSKWATPGDGHFRALDPIADWEQRFVEHGKAKAEIKLRLVIRASVNFQIMSALWIMKVGHKFDAVSDPRVSRGNRLRRKKRFVDGEFASLGPLNLATPGLFAPYFSAYKEWREEGLRLMEDSLDDGKKILAVTMDVEQFYHRVSPKFLLRSEFLERTRVRLSPFDKRFTRQLINAIESWYRTTPDFSERPEGGLPVGLSASKIIANVLLNEFDREVMTKLKPIYYGRYVDDIFLVLRQNGKTTSAKGVMAAVARKLGPIVELVPNDNAPPSLKLVLPYAKDSNLIFAGPKQKIFSLAPPHGLDLIEHIREQIRVQSSEHRLLPSLPETAVGMAARALLATPDASLQVDALRKADVVSVRRLGLSLLLRDIEAFASDLSPDSWERVRKEFYGLVNRHVITPLGFFEFFSYVHRVFGLMLSCEDYVEAEDLVFKLAAVIQVLKKTTTAADGAIRVKFESCVSQYALALNQAGLQASTVRRLKTIDSRYLRVLKKIRGLSPDIDLPTNIGQLKAISKSLLLSDWGRRSYKDYWYLDQRSDEDSPPVPVEREIRKVLRLGAIRRFRERSTTLKVPYWPALAFPTRPLRVDEIAMIAPTALENKPLFTSAINSLRGAKVISKARFGMTDSNDGIPVHFSAPLRRSGSLRVAITSILTSEAQAMAAAQGSADRSFDRYRDLNNLLNSILKERNRPQYIVLPELSLPLRWAMRISKKLATNNVSLIAGIEYYRDSLKRLRNDCLVSLVTQWPGYRTNVSRLQPKFQPAHGEREGLATLGATGRLFEPTGSEAVPTVYDHGGFYFSILICSDLTNISHRHALRGHIDALFALEWNRDVKTFAPLVEATASDLHAFVIQVNNRLYGDSRIRAPAKEDYQRDIVQVKGGASDYYVVGEIDCERLRDEQKSSGVSEDFKPVPIGFRMSDRRRKAISWFSKKSDRRKHSRRRKAA